MNDQMMPPIRQPDGFYLITDIIHRFEVEVSIKYVTEPAQQIGVPLQASPYATYNPAYSFTGYLIKFGNVEHRCHQFTQFDKERVLEKLGAMYPEKVLTKDEMKKHIYKDALGDENV